MLQVVKSVCTVIWTRVAITIISICPFLTPSYATEISFQASPKADSRGFIDVWQLRRDVAMVEALQTTDDTDYCYPEGDPEEELSSRQLRQLEQQSAACETEIHLKYAAYKKVYEAFNKAWLPIIYRAIRKGDKVAEVIMRQCETTPVLQRNGIESTCDGYGRRHKIAVQRLLKIGFMPAVDISDELIPNPSGFPEQKKRNQLATLKKVRTGALGFNQLSVHVGGNSADNDEELELYKRWTLLEAVIQDAPRAFTYSPAFEDGWATSGFASLSLNRKPLTPGFLIWGYPGHWRSKSMEVDLPDWSTVYVAGSLAPEFLRAREKLLAEIDSNIDRSLAEDPRWGVFLLHRVGRHEWVPEGTESNTWKLDPSWLGHWELEQTFLGWRLLNMQPEKTDATITQSNDSTTITFRTPSLATPPLEDAIGCQLRYSGGRTYLPSTNNEDSLSTETVIGYMGAYPIPGLVDVFKPLDRTKRYRQVLVLCPQGEWTDNDRVRFLLLAGDTMIEIAKNGSSNVYVRHFRRVKTLAEIKGVASP